MEIETYIKKNKQQLKAYIKRLCPNIDNNMLNNDEEIEAWILNDECLYNEALNCGVVV